MHETLCVCVNQFVQLAMYSWITTDTTEDHSRLACRQLQWRTVAFQIQSLNHCLVLSCCIRHQSADKCSVCSPFGILVFQIPSLIVLANNVLDEKIVMHTTFVVACDINIFWILYFVAWLVAVTILCLWTVDASWFHYHHHHQHHHHHCFISKVAIEVVACECECMCIIY